MPLPFRFSDATFMEALVFFFLFPLLRVFAPSVLSPFVSAVLSSWPCSGSFPWSWFCSASCSWLFPSGLFGAEWCSPSLLFVSGVLFCWLSCLWFGCPSPISSRPSLVSGVVGGVPWPLDVVRIIRSPSLSSVGLLGLTLASLAGLGVSMAGDVDRILVPGIQLHPGAGNLPGCLGARYHGSSWF